MRQIGRITTLAIMAITISIGVLVSEAEGRKEKAVTGIDARIVAVNIPGASALAQIGTFLNNPTACARPIPWKAAPVDRP